MKKRRIKKKNNKQIIDFKLILIIIIPFIIAGLGFFLYERYYETKLIPEEKEIINNQDNKKEEEKIPVEEYINELPQAREQYNNPNIMGKIEIPNLNINSWVLRGNDNKYYLSHSIYMPEDGFGVPFFDYRNINLLKDRQINLYGHNTQNSTYYSQLPFTNLELYTDINVFNNYKDIYLYIDEAKIKYEIIAIKILKDGNNEHMKLNFTNDDEYLEHVNKMLSNSLYVRENATVSVDERLIVLQICHYDPIDSYLLVVGKTSQ